MDDAFSLPNFAFARICRARIVRHLQNAARAQGREGRWGKRQWNLVAAALLATVACASTAWAAGSNNPPPAGSVILDLNGTAIPHSYQLYTTSFTAAQAATNLSFAFREDPAYIYLSNVTMVNTTTSSSTNLVQNGNFALGPVGANQPTNWSYLNIFGASAAGYVRSGCGQGGGNCYYDGSVQAYDAITQTITTIVGDIYTVSFYLMDDSSLSTFSHLSTNGDVSTAGGNGADALVYAGNAPTPATGGNIDTVQAYYLASNVGSTVNPVFVGGTLRMNQANTGYAFNFTLDNSGTNTIDQYGNNSIFSGVFSDASVGVPGTIIVANSGTGGSVAFSGVNTYTGTTTINAGATLALAGSGSIATSSGVIDNGTFDISATTAGTSIVSLSDTAVAPGTVVLGGKTLTLTGANGKFYGNIAGDSGSGLVIAGGSESLGGTLTASSLIVNAGATLRGVGTINAPTTVSGTLAPGNSPGRLTLTAPLVLTSGSTSEFDIDGTGTGTGAGNYSSVVVTGASNTATVAGVLQPLLRGITGSANNTYSPPIGQQFQVMSAQGGVVGSYASLTQPSGLLNGTRFDAIYAPSTLTLVTTPSYYGNLPLAGLPETSNEAAVGRALDSFRPAAGVRMSSGLEGLFYPLYVLPGAQVPPALDLLSPVIYGDGLMAVRQAWYEVADSVAEQLAARRAGTASSQAVLGPLGATIWMNGIGQFANVSTPGYAAYSTSLGGAVAGIDVPVAEGAVAGLAVGGFNSQTNTNTASADASGVQFTAYGGLQSGIFFADGQVATLLANQDVRRNMSLFGGTATSTGAVSGTGAQLHGGVKLDYGALQIEPTVGLTVVSLTSGAVSESATGVLAQRIGNQSLTSVQSLLGARVSTKFDVGAQAPLFAHASLGWQHEYAAIGVKTSSTFQVAGAAPFIVSSTPLARNMARLGAGFDVVVSPEISLYGSYQAELGQNASAQYLTGGLRIVW